MNIVTLTKNKETGINEEANCIKYKKEGKGVSIQGSIKYPLKTSSVLTCLTTSSHRY